MPGRIEGRDGHDGDVPESLVTVSLRQHLEPVHPGHYEIEQDHVWMRLARQRQRLLAVGRGHYTIVLLGRGEHAPEQA